MQKNKEKSNNVDLLFTEAKLLRSRNRPKEATEILEQILKINPKNTEALNEYGACLHILGKKEDSISIFKKSIEIDPKKADSHFMLGALMKDNQQFKEAIDHFLSALAIDPIHERAKMMLAATFNDYGSQLKSQGDIQSGIKYYELSLKYNPNLANAYYNLGVIANESGKLDEAKQYYEKALSILPNYIEALCNLGVIYKTLGQLETAIQYYEKAIKINPNINLLHMNMAIALTDLGTELKRQGKMKEAIQSYERALEHHPYHAEAYYNLGVIHSEMRQLSKAIYYYQMATHFNEQFAEAYNNMGVLYKFLGNVEKSIECYQQAILKNPSFAQTYNNLGVIYTIQGRMDLAREQMEQAIKCNPLYAEAYNNFGVLLRDEGKVHEAIEKYEKCLEIEPLSRNAGQNKLLAMNYIKVDLKKLQEEHVKWGKKFMKQFNPYTEWPNERKKDKKLKIGYVSADFFTHSVSYFIDAPLRCCKNTEIFCYSNVSKGDGTTERLKSYVKEDHWRNIFGMGTKEAAELIRKDGIDILVDLTGHTANNRLDIMAMKPAPIQVTWIGYPNTTGLPTIDYRIVDKYTDPEDTEQELTEERIRLPHFLCYTPCKEEVPITQLPYLENSVITFGTFNNLGKITDDVILIWSQILQKVPHSRLLLKCKPFQSERVRNEFLSKCEKYGIPSNRIDLMSLIPNHVQHLSAYSLVDIGLDVFPYAGTTTTCESLYMGVPVITLKGNTHAHNVGVSLLTAIGHEEFIATTEDEYINLAVKLANDIPKLSKIRKELRHKMLSSPLCDGETFTKILEEEYQKMWIKFCERQN